MKNFKQATTIFAYLHKTIYTLQSMAAKGCLSVCLFANSMSERVSGLFCKLCVSQTAACCLLPGEHVDKPLQESNKFAGVWQAVGGGKWKSGIPTRTSKSVGSVAVTVVVVAVAAVAAS